MMMIVIARYVNKYGECFGGEVASGPFLRRFVVYDYCGKQSCPNVVQVS